MRKVIEVRKVIDVRKVAASLVVWVGLAACSAPDQSGTAAQRVRAWSSGAGLSSIASALSGDADQFAVGRAKDDRAKLQSTCTSLLNDASMGATGLPTPDPGLTTDLNSAYDTYYRAGQLCLGPGGIGPGVSRGGRSGPGPSGTRPKELNQTLGQAAAQIAKGSADLARAQGRLRTILR